MGILDNVLSKMQATPQFRPISADTFSDWSIEAGDILTVEVEGKDEVLPVFSADMDWGGAAKSTLSCSGSRERPTLSKAERQQYAAFGGISSGFASKLKKVSDDIIEDRNELIAALNGKDGVPEDLASGLKNYVRYDLKNGDMLATSKLFSKIGEKARSEITTYAYVDKDGNAHSLVDIIAKVDDTESGLSTKVGTKALNETLKNYALASALSNYLTVTAAAEMYVTDSDVTAAIGAYIVQDANGNRKSLAAILADVIKLQGDTEILGNLSISEGRLSVSKGITASGTSFIVGDLYTQGAIHPVGGIIISDKKFGPTPITSTDGTEYMVLGA